jgi:hypothetical protein
MALGMALRDAPEVRTGAYLTTSDLSDPRYAVVPCAITHAFCMDLDLKPAPGRLGAGLFVFVSCGPCGLWALCVWFVVSFVAFI